MDKLTKIKEYYENNSPFIKYLGIKVIKIGKGYAKTSMDITKTHHNSIGIAHGGAIFTLVDATLGVAALSHGFAVVTTNANISYLNPGINGPLVAEAKEINRSKKLGVYEVKVIDNENTIVAVAQGTMYIKRMTYPPEHQ